MYNEMKQSVRDDIDFFISDRSALDFFAYYDYCINNNDNKKILKNIVYEWIKSYDYIYFLSPLPYINDGKRPDNVFRNNVNILLKNMIEELNSSNLLIEIIKGEPNERINKIVNKIIKIENK